MQRAGRLRRLHERPDVRRRRRRECLRAGYVHSELRGYCADLNPDPHRFPAQEATVTPLAQWFAEQHGIEPFALPTLADLIAFVEGKSGLGRAGLFVATATQVAPGFKGSIVLELFNSGTVPLLLRPGMSIAQLVFVQTDCPLPSDWLYRGGSSCQVKPPVEFSS